MEKVQEKYGEGTYPSIECLGVESMLTCLFGVRVYYEVLDLFGDGEGAPRSMGKVCLEDGATSPCDFACDFACDFCMRLL